MIHSLNARNEPRARWQVALHTSLSRLRPRCRRSWRPQERVPSRDDPGNHHVSQGEGRKDPGKQQGLEKPGPRKGSPARKPGLFFCTGSDPVQVVHESRWHKGKPRAEETVLRLQGEVRADPGPGHLGVEIPAARVATPLGVSVGRDPVVNHPNPDQSCHRSNTPAEGLGAAVRISTGSTAGQPLQRHRNEWL